MWQLFTLAGTIYEITTEEGSEIGCIADEACFDLVNVSVRAGVAPAAFAAKVISAIVNLQYEEYRSLIRTIASARSWAPAYIFQLRVLLQQSLTLHPEGGSSSKFHRDLQYALKELDLGSQG
jgi:hypothetical protein